MGRSAKKGPFVDGHLLEKLEKQVNARDHQLLLGPGSGTGGVGNGAVQYLEDGFRRTPGKGL